MTYYTKTIPTALAEKLKGKGMPITMSNHLHQVAPDVRGLVKANFKEIDCPTYAEVLDWLMEKGINIRIESDWEFDNRDELDIVTSLATDFFVEKVGKSPIFVNVKGWHEAADAAIEIALRLIEENEK